MRRYKTASGMTLVEILFAFAIVGTVLTVSYSSALRAWRSAVGANQRTEALFAAQNAIEQVKAYRDLSDSTTAQDRMTWTGAANGNGTGGFISELQQTPGGFTIQQCSRVSIPNCEWTVVDGPWGYTAPGDNTDFTVVVVVTELFCEGGTVSTLAVACGNENLIDAMSVEATVTWQDGSGSGITNNAVANTILTRPE